MDDGYGKYYQKFDEIPEQELWDMYKSAKARIDEAMKDENEDMPISDEDDALMDYFYKFERGRNIMDRYANLFNDKDAEKHSELGEAFFKDKNINKDQPPQDEKKDNNSNPFKFPPFNLN